jgi:hypothetical protein
MKLITAHVKIGKSKEIVTYIFHERDFDRIEDFRLYLKNEERVLKIDQETQYQVIYQMNLND